MPAPALSVYANGQGAVTADNLNTFLQTCDTITQLRTIVGVTGMQVFARGNIAIGDGGQGDFYWSSTSTADDDAIDVIKPLGGGFYGRWVRLTSVPQYVATPEAFGAIGNGIFDDTNAINACLAFAAARGLPVSANPFATYLVSSSGTRSFLNADGTSTYAAPVAIVVPNGTFANFCGATIKAKSGETCTLIANENGVAIGDVVRLYNLVLDGNNTIPTGDLCTWNGLSNGSEIAGLHAHSGNRSIIGFHACQDMVIEDCYSYDSSGLGITLGGNVGWQLQRCQIGQVRATNIAAFAQPNQPGNGLIFGAADTRCVSFYQRNCGGGIKILANTQNCHIDLAMVDGDVLSGEANNNTENSGFKIQGDSDAAPVVGLSIDTVRVFGQQGSGLFILFANSVQIGQYIGNGNGTLGTDPDITLNKFDDLDIGSITSQDAGQSGIGIVSPTDARLMSYRFGRVSIINPGTATSPTSRFFLFTSAGQGVIDHLAAIDSRSPQTAGFPAVRVLDNTQGARILVQSFRANTTGTTFDFTNGVQNYRLTVFGDGTSPLSGTFSPAASATTTVVANQNARVNNAGSVFSVPIINLRASNAAARTLQSSGPVYITVGAQSLTLNHPAAAGTELFVFDIEGYQASTAAPS